MADDKPRNESTALGGVIHILEKISEFRVALIALHVWFAMDIGLLLGFGNGVLTFDWVQLNASSYSKVGGIFLIYVCWMAILSLPLRVLTEEVVVPFFRAITPKIRGSDPYGYMLLSGRAPLHKARKKAMKEKDEFWIKRVDAFEVQLRNQQARLDGLAGLSFSIVCLALLDLLLAPDSFVGELISKWDSGQYFLPMTALCIFVIVLFTWLHQSLAEFERTEPWIEHPELAKELHEQYERNRARSHTFLPKR